MINALILTGWYNKPKDNWYPWLKTELEKRGYTVSIPELPTIETNLPDPKPMLEMIDPLVNSDTVIIGHSLGALLALRLAENKPYAKAIIVSGWDFDDGLAPEHKLFWTNKIDHQTIKRNVKEFVVIHSDNDPYTPANDAKAMAERLNGKFVLIKNGGHLSKKEGNFTELPVILNYL